MCSCSDTDIDPFINDRNTFVITAEYTQRLPHENMINGILANG